MTDPESDKPIPDSDDAILKELLERHKYALERWQPTRDEGDLNMDALSVEGGWPDADRKVRKAEGRPCGHTDIISQFNNRVVNQGRMNKRGVKVVPKGASSNPDSAALREDRIRQIEEESDAAAARLTGLQNAVDRGYGHWWVRTEEVSPLSFDLRIVIDRCPNPDSTLIDPDCEKADFSDMRYAFRHQIYTKDEFPDEFPDAEIKSFASDDERVKAAGSFITDKTVTVVEYWKVEKTHKKKYQIETIPQVVLEDDPLLEGSTIEKGVIRFPDGRSLQILKEGTAVIKSVCQYVSNGVEILAVDGEKKRKWPGTTIPCITVIGREKYVRGERKIEALTTKMRHPQLMFDLADAAEQEELTTIPKPKFLVPDQSIDGFDEWKDLHRNPRLYARYRQYLDGNPEAKLNPPQRIDFPPQLEAYEIAKNSAYRNSQNTAGMTSADAKDRVAKSGVAQDKLDQAADISNYHFFDNWNGGIKYELRVVNEVLDKVEDTVRTVGLRKEGGDYRTGQLDVYEGQPHPYGKGEDNDVVVEVGPAYQAQHDKVTEFVSEFSNALRGTPMFERVAWLLVKLQNLGPEGKQISELLMPPDVRQAKEAEQNGQQPLPPEVLQQLQKMQQVIQLLQQKLQEAMAGLPGKKLEAESKEKIAATEAQMTVQLKSIEAELEKEKMRIQLQIQQMKGSTVIEKTDKDNATKLEIADQQAETADKQALAAHVASERDREAAQSAPESE